MKALLFFILFFNLSQSYAIEPQFMERIRVASKHGFKITIEEGKPLQVIWPDGRVASSFSRSSPITNIEVPMTVAENLCVRSSPKIKCTYKFDIRMDHLEMRWIKNKDPKRLGQVVARMGSATVEQEIIWFSGIKKLAPVSTLGLKNDRLECESWEWLPEGKKTTAPETLFMSSFDSDTMGANVITEASVNLGLHGYHGLHWKRQDNALELTSVDNYYSASPFLAPPFFGFATSVTIQNLKASDPMLKYCQVAIQIDTPQLKAKIRPLTMMGEAKPYILGSDDLYAAVDLTGYFFNVLFSLGTEQTLNGKLIYGLDPYE